MFILCLCCHFVLTMQSYVTFCKQKQLFTNFLHEYLHFYDNYTHYVTKISISVAKRQKQARKGSTFFIIIYKPTRNPMRCTILNVSSTNFSKWFYAFGQLKKQKVPLFSFVFLIGRRHYYYWSNSRYLATMKMSNEYHTKWSQTFFVFATITIYIQICV